MTARSAMVFPGMGPSGFPDVAKFMLVNPLARDVVAEADDVLGYSLFDACSRADGEYNEHAQVAFMVSCLAFARWAETELGVRPDVVAGPSFGGRAASVYAGSLGFAEGVRMTAALAGVMAGYFAAEHRDVVTHSFVRVPEDELAGILGDLTEAGHWHEVSCVVDNDFHMLSLRTGQLEWLRRRLNAAGGLSLYTMRPPMHASILAGLRDRVAKEVFGRVGWTDPVLPVVADQDGTVVRTGAGVRTMLLDGFTKPVRWPRVVAALRDLGVGTVYVAGPDSMFSRVRCTTVNFEVVGLDSRSVLRPRARV